VRAALEAIAFQLDDAFVALRADSPVPVREVHCDGGPTANRFLMQFTADVTATALEVAPMAECSALGAVKAGREGLGLAGPECSRDTPPPVIYTPQMDSDQVARLKADWHHAVAQTILPRGAA
jgi:glycerol kinase